MSDLHLFEGHGIELEYMIVKRDSLEVLPICDEVLRAVGGGYEQEVDRGPIAWSNELALHVIELKTNGPVRSLSGVATQFQAELTELDELLARFDARILPTAMHPWMDPYRELKLWPHQNDVIYQTFHPIFDCRGHGWANLQSMHINLPFSGDEEFGRLHAAIRLVLPILPALAASSPISDGMVRPDLDTRLSVYRHNAASVPSVSGVVVPERVFTRQAYEGELLQRIYDDLAPHDPEGVLRDEWVNARGAIARFDRMAIEIRVLDVQECPAADLAIAMAVTSVVKALVNEELCDGAQQRAWDERALSEILVRGIRDAEEAVVDDASYLACLGLQGVKGPMHVREIWQSLMERVIRKDPTCSEGLPALSVILNEGCLARRIRHALGTHHAQGSTPEREELKALYLRLADCLRTGQQFRA